jgi:electron transport complex protein RnfG
VSLCLGGKAGFEMSKIKYFFEQSWLLIVSSFCFGLLIAVTNAALSPTIQKNKATELDNLTKALLPDAKRFAEVDAEFEVKLAGGEKERAKVYKAVSEAGKCVGWSFNASGKGFADKIELVVAVDKNFEKIAGFNVLASNETPGFGDRIKSSYYRDQFAGAPAEKLELIKTGDPKKIDSEIVAITGATVSSKAVIEIINTFLIQIKDQMRQKGLIGNGKG